ncbi:MAG: hypothetical protein U0230_08760 [Polyangiales bacterium]
MRRTDRFLGRTRRASVVCLLALAGVYGSTGTALADATWWIPVGGRTVRWPNGPVICADASDHGGFAIDTDGLGIRPPPTGVGTSATLRMAPDPAHCEASTSAVRVVAVGPLPSVDPASVELDTEAGTVTLRGRSLARATLRWTAGDRSGEDRCDAATGAAEPTTCTFSVGRGLPADPSLVSLTLVPEGASGDTDVVLFDGDGRTVTRATRLFHPARIVVGRPFEPGATIDATAGAARVPLLHPEAVATVDCTDAVCDLDGDSLLVRDEHGSDDVLEVHVHLRPHVVARDGDGTDGNPVARLPLSRCPATLVGALPIRGASESRAVLRVDGSCAADRELEATSANGTVRRVDRLVLGGSTYVVLALDRVDSDEVLVVLRRESGVAAHVRLPTRRVLPPRARLELEGVGEIDFLPTNRAVHVLLPSLPDAGVLEPVSVEGVYEATREGSGHFVVRATPHVAGAVPLRFAYRDPTLPGVLSTLVLGFVTEPVERVLRTANVPRALGTESGAGEGFVELLCGNGAHATVQVEPGRTTPLPFRSRDTCHLVFHRELLREEDGVQVLALRVDVRKADGSPVHEARVDQRVVLRPGREPRVVYLGGIEDPFDRLSIRVSVATEGADWARPPDEDVDAPELSWTVVMGTDRLRIYGTTTIPAALFRVSDHSGIMALNAGALFRLVALSREGRESIVGFESGVMWVSIAGTSADVQTSRFGELSLVAGLGLGVPIANPSRASQTSIAIHAWFEYEVSRAFRPHDGSPLGFVFGPSITIGDLGTSF